MGLWDRLSLTYRFGVAAGLVMIVGMLIIGAWVEGQIRERVTANSAAITALFMDSILSPLSQELADKDTLSAGPATALIELMRTPMMRDRIVSIKLWKPDGRIAYSSDLALIGQTFELTEGLRDALNGGVAGQFNQLDEAESAREAAAGKPLLEIYAPLRAEFTGEVIAVAEIYEDASELAASFVTVRNQSWLVVAGSTIVMALVLLGIVHSGSVLIDRQQSRLAKAHKDNLDLLRRIARATARSSELTERQLRRVSADLHDGPAQLVSVAALRLDSLKKGLSETAALGEFDAIKTALDDAMRDIRNICRGLSLPEIEQQSLSDAVTSAVRAHEARSGTRVELRIKGEGDPPPHVKICTYRFVQEGLSNAFRHGDRSAGDPVVEVSLLGDTLSARVENVWSPEPEAAPEDPDGGLGLTGLRERVESLGGVFEFLRDAQNGARLSMRLNMREAEQNG